MQEERAGQWKGESLKSLRKIRAVMSKEGLRTGNERRGQGRRYEERAAGMALVDRVEPTPIETGC